MTIDVNRLLTLLQADYPTTFGCMNIIISQNSSRNYVHNNYHQIISDLLAQVVFKDFIIITFQNNSDANGPKMISGFGVEDNKSITPFCFTEYYARVTKINTVIHNISRIVSR